MCSFQTTWRKRKACTYLRLNLEVSLSKKESPRPPLPPPLPWLIDETSLLSDGTANVPVLVGAALDRLSFTVPPEMVVRYTTPRLKFILLPAGTVGERAETPVLETSSDGLHSQHPHTDWLSKNWHPTWHKIGYLWEVLPSQSLGLVLKN